MRISSDLYSSKDAVFLGTVAPNLISSSTPLKDCVGAVLPTLYRSLTAAISARPPFKELFCLACSAACVYKSKASPPIFALAARLRNAVAWALIPAVVEANCAFPLPNLIINS